MPLVGKTLHVCLNCGNERTLTPSDWILDDIDPTVFTSPLCTCGAQETFCWHDDVVMDQVVDQRVFPPEVEGGPERRVLVSYMVDDPEHYEALHMTLIGEVASDLGLKQKKVKSLDKPSYSKAPRKPSAKEMRSKVSELRESLKPRQPVSKTEADRQYNEAVVKAKEHAKQRKLEKQEIHERKTQSRYKGVQPDKQVPLPKTVAPETKPLVDEEIESVDNPPEDREGE